MHEFYSKDGIECIKVEFLLGSNHNCVIEVILSECYVKSHRRISYYTTLNEKYEGFGIPTWLILSKVVCNIKYTFSILIHKIIIPNIFSSNNVTFNIQVNYINVLYI